MKQKVVTKAIIKHDDKVLLLRRHGGRPSIDGLYELPGGRVHSGQQPKDALSHALRIHLNVTIESSRIADVMTFLDPDDRRVQYVFIIFFVTVRSTGGEIGLSNEYDKAVWKVMSDIQPNDITQSTQQILGMLPAPFAPGRAILKMNNNDDKKSTYERLIGYADGGSRGNPGVSAAGFVLIDTTGAVVAQGGAYIGVATSEMAEYQALYLLLGRALDYGVRRLEVRIDSELVVDQMNKIHIARDHELVAIRNRINELLGRFEKVSFHHINREDNTLADGIVNKVLNEQGML